MRKNKKIEEQIIEGNIVVDKDELTKDLIDLTKDYRLHKSIMVQPEEFNKVIAQDKTEVFNDLIYVKQVFADKIKEKNIFAEIEEVKMKNNSFLNKIKKFFKIKIV